MKRKIVLMSMIAILSLTFVACGKEDKPAEGAPEVQKEVETQKVAETQKVPETQKAETPEQETEKATEVETEVEADTQEDAKEESIYSVCTSKSTEEVEAFAKKVTEYFEKEDWAALAECIYYPITINEKYYDSKEKFLKTDWSKKFSEEYKKNIVSAEINNMMCNWQGIILADGLIWISENDDVLTVSRINYFDGTSQADAATGIVGHWELDYEKTEKNLVNAGSLRDIFGTGIDVGGSLAINGDGTFSLSLGLEEPISGAYDQDENIVNLYYKDQDGNTQESFITFEVVDDKLVVTSEFEDEQLYWKKLEE